uniref:uncharacterized protein n=1 Tax=Semicossyphus pulcher TaxID=241346 RepID=UPI0037E9B922
MAKEAELLYRTVQWDESLLQSAGKKAAGPLFNMKCSEDALRQIHFPHCDTKEALLVDGLLSVVHITDDGMSFLKPLEITDTHVVVEVPHLSAFGLVWDLVKRFLNMSLPINGQVLLFLRPVDTTHEVLDVLLLQENIVLHEVVAQQGGAEYIRISSDCHLSFGQMYSVHCEPEGFTIQPDNAPFRLKYGPNFYPTFEVFLTTHPEKVTLMVQDQDRTVAWKRDVILTGSRREPLQRTVPAEDRVPAQRRFPAEDRVPAQRSVPAEDRVPAQRSVPAEDRVPAQRRFPAEDRVPAQRRFPAEDRVPAQCRGPAEDRVPAEETLRSVRTNFLNKVSEPVLNQLLDELLQHGVINDGEMQSIRTKVKAEKARDLIDTVRRKGREASSVLITALREVDPCLSRELDLS